MTTDWVTRGIAIAGAASGFGALGWNAYTWKRSGASLKASAVVTGRRADMTISGRINNKGRLDATIDKAFVGWRVPSTGGTAATPVISTGLPDGHMTGVTPKQKLPAQQGVEYIISDIEGIDPGFYLALHDRRPASLTFVTVTGAKAKAQIKYTKG